MQLQQMHNDWHSCALLQVVLSFSLCFALCRYADFDAADGKADAFKDQIDNLFASSLAGLGK